MKPTLATHLLFALGFALLAAVNFMVLSQVEANRKGESDAVLWLTERELPVVDRLAIENNGMALRLVWRSPDNGNQESNDRIPSWLTVEKLQRLGFVVAVPAAGDLHRKREIMTRPVFLVLEFNGPAYLEARRRAERALEREEEAVRANPADKSLQATRQQAKKRVRAEELSLSRLFAIDVGTDPTALRTLYPNRSRYIVTPGAIQLLERTDNGREVVGGVIDSVSIDTIHVPLEHRRIIDSLLPQGKSSSQDEGKPPRYNVLFAYGSRLEPWIAAVRPPGE